MPPDHPARDMQDTFYLAGRAGPPAAHAHLDAARSATCSSNPHPPDVRIICPGKVYRRDDDITHSPMFQQIEGLVVGPGITLGRPQGHDRGLPARALRARSTRCASARRSSPTPSRRWRSTSAASSAAARAAACARGPAGSRSWARGWSTPRCSRRSTRAWAAWSTTRSRSPGFAFGLGIERVAMVRHGIDDIRLFYESDLRFLEQFRGDEGPALLAEGVRRRAGRAAPPRRRPDAGRAWPWSGSRRDGDDAVLDLDITTNRVDCMNVYGVAREVSVLYGVPLRPLGRSASPRRARRRRRALDGRDRGPRPVPALLRARARRRASARRRPGCATGWSRSACARSTTWWTSPTT